MTLKATKDFIVDESPFKKSLKRGVQIDGKSSTLTVDYTMNPRKGLFGVVMKIDNDQIMTNDAVQNEATLQAIMGLTLAAIEKGIAWRSKWKEENQEQGDPNQLEIVA